LTHRQHQLVCLLRVPPNYTSHYEYRIAVKAQLQANKRDAERALSPTPRLTRVEAGRSLLKPCWQSNEPRFLPCTNASHLPTLLRNW
jgi:hypothetical protein